MKIPVYFPLYYIYRKRKVMKPKHIYYIQYENIPQEIFERQS